MFYSNDFMYKNHRVVLLYDAATHTWSYEIYTAQPIVHSEAKGKAHAIEHAKCWLDKLEKLNARFTLRRTCNDPFCTDPTHIIVEDA
jgi:hypothetical protein